jgi:hypothetical protein
MMLTGIMAELGHFKRKWRFTCYGQHALRVIRWHLTSEEAFLPQPLIVEQWPQLCYESGPIVVETPGPSDLKLLAIVELVGKRSDGNMMPLGFLREEIT